MMNTKKNWIWMMVGIIVGMIISIGIFYMTIGDMEWQPFLEEELIPTATIVLTSVGTVCVAAIPIVSRVRLAIDKFDGATDDVNKTAKGGKTVAEEVKMYGEQVSAMKAQIDPLTAEVKALREMCLIGFCNSDELVTKGVAERIAGVGAEVPEDGKEKEV